MFQVGEVQCKKKTHSSRGSGAREIDAAGVSIDQIARLGNWAHGGGHLLSSYLRGIPIPATLAAAGFSPTMPLSEYYLPRLDAPVSEELERLARTYIFYGADEALVPVRQVRAKYTYAMCY